MAWVQLLDGFGTLAWLILFWLGILGLKVIGVVALVGGGIAWLVNPSYANCFWYALRRWWTEGGYVVMLWSAWTPFPHFVWSSDLITFWEWHPVRRRRRRWLPPVVFRGIERRWTP